ncbi:MAG: hypothetical protein ACRBEQ_03800 [Hyphomonas sp.]
MDIRHILFASVLLAGCSGADKGNDAGGIEVTSCEHKLQLESDSLCGSIAFDQAEYAFKSPVRVTFTVRNQGSQTAKHVAGIAGSNILVFEAGRPIVKNGKNQSELSMDFGDIGPGEEKSFEYQASSNAAGSLGASLAIGRDNKPVGGSQRSEINHYNKTKMLPGETDKSTEDFFEIRDKCASRYGANKEKLRACMKDAGVFD